MPPEMDLTLILRDTPVKGDAAHRLLYSLCPMKILYSVDFGLRISAKNLRSGAHYERLEAKIAGLKEVTPFNGATEIAPMLPSYWFSEPLDDETRGYAAGEAFRLFAGVKTIYFDLGVQPQVDNALALAETIWKMDNGSQIVFVVPISSLLDEGMSKLRYESLPNARIGAFLSPSASLEYGLHTALTLAGPETEVFVSHLSEDDAKNLCVITEKSPLKGLVFWSALAAKDINLPVKENCKDEPAKEEDPFVEHRALFSSMIRDRAAMDAELLGHVGVGERIKIHVLKPKTGDTVFGRVALSEGKVGYVVVKHHNQAKFEETT